MRNSGWLPVLGLLFLGACGDDAAAPQPCPMGVLAGQMVACQCADMSGGAQTCGTDNLLTECMCGTGGTLGGVGGTPPGAGGEGGEGGTSNPVGTTGGTAAPSGGTGGAISMGEDAGIDPGAGGEGGAGGTGATMAPMDGNQNALCESGLDCNMGLDCYLPAGVGMGYCTIPCMGDMACNAIAGADYTCSPEGRCRVVCDGEMDTTSCPEGMACIAPGGVSGPGAGRCNWPEGGGTVGGTPAWGRCETSAACEDGLSCALPTSTGPFPGSDGPGYCSKSCMLNIDCPDAPATGDISPTCEQGGLGTMNGVCALDCFGAPDGCPDGMTCQSLLGGFFRRCGYEP